jgi:hypothetical protein
VSHISHVFGKSSKEVVLVINDQLTSRSHKGDKMANNIIYYEIHGRRVVFYSDTQKWTSSIMFFCGIVTIVLGRQAQHTMDTYCIGVASVNLSITGKI